MIIRCAVEEDAAAFLTCVKQLDEETKFMLFEPGERDVTIEDQARTLRKIQDSGHSIYFIALEDDRIVGFIAGIGSSIKRISHSLMIVIGILKDYHGQGIGTQLFNRIEEWAKEHGKERLELTVMTHNEHALGLYKKQGFEIEGTKRHSLMIDGQSINEYYMAKLI